MPGAGRRGGRKVPAVRNSKTIHGIEMKFGWVIENHTLINLVSFNWQMTSSLRHNRRNFRFLRNLADQNLKLEM